MPPSSSPRAVVVDLQSTAPRWALPPERAAALIAAAPPGWEVRVIRAPTESEGDGGAPPSAELVAALGDAEVYFGYGLPAAVLEAAPRLRWAQSAAAGVRSLLGPALAARPELVLTNAAGIMAVPIAEHVLAGVLHFLRGLDVAVAQQRAAVWDRAPWAGPAPGAPDAAPREMGECRVLVVGAGGIGAAVAERLSALGATCVGVRRRPSAGVPPGFARVVGPDGLDGELPTADVVVLAAPFTDATARLLDGRRLALLPRGAIVVNVGRGALLDEDALVPALAAGRLRGAVLDVAGAEPLPPASPLWGRPDVLLTPHVSATSPRRFWDRLLALFLDNWDRWRRDAPLRNVVDPAAGY
jgi:phosphoglycerate dehydrogenase-like enzyme